MPSLVTRDQLPAAIALNAITYNLSRALDPIAGVFVIARWDIPTAFAINSLSYLALAGALIFVNPAPQQIQTTGPIRLRDSVRTVRADRMLMAPLIVVGLVSLTADPVNTLSPAFATDVYGMTDTFTGFLVGAFGAGFGFLSSVSAATSLLHLEVSDEQRGRVMALWSLSFQGSRPIGSPVDGAVASLASIRLAGLAMVLPALAGCLGLAALSFKRRRAGVDRLSDR